MRDGFYGIAGAWDVANATHHEQFRASLLWMLSRARPDGILPQMCPPPDPADPAGSACDYGNGLCNDTVGAPGWQRCQDLDTMSFAIKLAHQIWSNLPPEDAAAF